MSVLSDLACARTSMPANQSTLNCLKTMTLPVNVIFGLDRQVLGRSRQCLSAAFRRDGLDFCSTVMNCQSKSQRTGPGTLTVTTDWLGAPQTLDPVGCQQA